MFEKLTRRSALTRIVATAGAGLLVAGLAACGDKKEPEATAAKEFTYWSMWKETEPQAKVLKDAADAFTKDTGIKVKIEWQGRDIMKKVTPALRSGEVPDLVDQDANAVRATMVTNDSSRDLSAVFAAKVPGEDKTVSEVGAGRYADLVKDKNGKPFMVPYEVIGYGIYFNGATMPEATTTPPATWEDFIKLLDARKAAGKKAIALDGDIGFYNGLWTTSILMRELGPGKLAEIANDKSGAGWEQPKVLEALKKVEQLGKGGYFVDGSFGSKWPAVQEKWAAGKADMLLMGSWAPSEVEKSTAPGFQHRQFNFPSIGGGDDSALAAIIGFSIPKKAKNADAAEKFIAYFMKKDKIGGISSTALNITPRADVEAPAVLADIAKVLNTKKIALGYDGTDVIPNYGAEVFEPVNNLLIQGKLSPADAVKQLKDKQIAFWKKNA